MALIFAAACRPLVDPSSAVIVHEPSSPSLTTFQIIIVDPLILTGGEADRGIKKATRKRTR